MKTLSKILSIIFLTSLSFSGFSQGCEDGGGDDDGVKLKGFIQPRFNYNFNEPDADGNNKDANSFGFDRARIGVLGSIPYDIKYYFFVEYSSFASQTGAVSIVDAFITYDRFGAYAKISMGQFKSPFSLEQNTSCSGLSTVLRSDVVTQLAGPQRDLGIMVMGGSDTTLLRYSAAVMNGSGKNQIDNNQGKDIVGRLQIQPLKDKSMLAFGGSFRFGKTDPTNVDVEPQNDLYRYAAELKFKYEGFTLQGEYIHGIDELYSTTKVPIYGG